MYANSCSFSSGLRYVHIVADCLYVNRKEERYSALIIIAAHVSATVELVKGVGSFTGSESPN